MARGIADRPRVGLAPGAARERAGAGVAEDSPREIRALVTRLAWPSIVENMLQSVFNILIIMMVSRLGSAAIAGVGGSNQILMVAMACFFALSMGTTVLVAHATGAGNREAASVAAKQSLTLGLLISAVITALGVTFAPGLLAAIGAEPEVVEAGAPFLRAIAAGSVFLVTSYVAGGALRGTGDARTPMLVTFGMLGLNLALAYLLLFGGAGLPSLGVAGAGLAAVLSRGAGCLVLLGLLLRSGHGVSIAGWHGWWPALVPLRRLVDIGLPSMLESLFRAGGMLFMTAIVFRLGTAVAAAQQIVQQAAFFSMMPGFGFSMASTTLVGQSLGARNPRRARQASSLATRSCLVWMGLMGLVFFFGGPWIMRAFTADAEIIGYGVAGLMVVALAQPGQAIGIVLAGSLRGAGDTRFPMLVTALGMWLIRLPLAYLFGITLGWGLPGVYLGWVVDSFSLALANWLRYRTGAWQHRRVAVA